MQAHLIACHECDLLLRLPTDIGPDEEVLCPRCHHKITAFQHNALDTVIALSLTALIVLIIAISYPFMSFETKGQSSSINLVDSAYTLFSLGHPVLAMLMFCFIVILPAVYLLCLLLVALPVRMNIERSPPVELGRFLSQILPWAMAEVFLIGVLVALIKIIAMADIVMGVSFWAYVLFTILFIYVSSIVDPHRLWDWIDPPQRSANTG